VHTVLAGPGGPPKVDVVYVDGSTWAQEFRQALSDAGVGGSGFGYIIPGGSGQLAPVPFAPVDRVSVRFTEDVDVDPAALRVVGDDGRSYLGPNPAFTYNTTYFIATWALSRPITADRVHFTLNSGGTGGVSDFSGAALDGEWTDGSRRYPSGDGTPGGSFDFRFNVLQGDVNRNGIVDVRDYLEARRRREDPQFPNLARYSVFADVDGNGRINVWDLLIVRRMLGRRLPIQQ
jgi:hypothetical protein